MTRSEACRTHSLVINLLLCCCICGIHSQAVTLTARRRLQESQEYFNEVKLKFSRDALAQQLKKARPAVDISSQQGIVIPAGGPVLLRNAAALVNVIRQHYRSDLPIEIFHQGPQEWHEAAGSLLKVDWTAPACSLLYCCQSTRLCTRNQAETESTTPGWGLLSELLTYPQCPNSTSDWSMSSLLCNEMLKHEA